MAMDKKSISKKAAPSTKNSTKKVDTSKPAASKVVSASSMSNKFGGK
jgi:hypothetical protein